MRYESSCALSCSSETGALRRAGQSPSMRADKEAHTEQCGHRGRGHGHHRDRASRRRARRGRCGARRHRASGRHAGGESAMRHYRQGRAVREHRIDAQAGRQRRTARENVRVGGRWGGAAALEHKRLACKGEKGGEKRKRGTDARAPTQSGTVEKEVRGSRPTIKRARELQREA